MELHKNGLDGPGGLSFQRLTGAYLDAAAELCGQCVGENLYPRGNLAAIMEKPDHWFYLLVTPEGEAAGYIYFFLTGLDEMAAFSKLSREQLAVVSLRETPILGNLQSIGVARLWRRRGLSKTLVRFYLDRLRRGSEADAAFGVFWKPDGHVPMEKTLQALDFRYLADAHRVWYDNQELVCPYCKGRCECDAAVYYKPIGREAAK